MGTDKKIKSWFWEVLTIPSFWRFCSYYHSWVGRKHPFVLLVVDSGQQSLLISYVPVPWHTNKRRIGPGLCVQSPLTFPLLLPPYSPSSNSCEFRGKGGQSIVLKHLLIIKNIYSVKWKLKKEKEKPIVWDLKVYKYLYILLHGRTQ
jgi:hypothetical protein